MKILPVAVALFLSLNVSAQPPAAKSRKAKNPDAAPASDASAETEKAPPLDGKKRIETTLAQRTKQLQDSHAKRLEFSAHEALLWEEFWDKERDARKNFELRTARQIVDLFSTLETLDPKDHASTVADFEKLRGTMVKSFESQQKQKMQDFFAAREARSRQFAEAQEHDRAAFAADAEATWQDDKGYLKSIYSPAPATAQFH
jgi:hypothetical protein